MPGLQTNPSKALKELNVSAGTRGCLEENNASGPRYCLNNEQALALRTFVTDWQSHRTKAKVSSPVSLALLQLNCYACHERDGRGGVGPGQWSYFENVQQVDIGDEGRMPPPLNFVGKKLQQSWLQKVLEGKGDVRPHFLARMPIFGDHAKSIAAGLVEADRGLELSNFRSEPLVSNKPDLDAGRELLDSGCVQCHAFRGESLPGTIGIDLAEIDKRLNHDWFRAFLLNPATLKKGTRMPSFFPEGKSSVPHILDGNVANQIESIWSYVNANNQPFPAKLEQSRSQSFELVPSDRPILLRTFMDVGSAGNNAIAVGLPEKLHFAFDASGLRLSEIWKGKFLNARGTWFDRFAPVAEPMGVARVLLPKHGWFVNANRQNQVVDPKHLKFLGYRLDAEGIPTFHYSVEDFKIRDRITARGDKGLLRRIEFEKPVSSDKSMNVESELWLKLSDEALPSESKVNFLTRSGVKMIVPNESNCRLVRRGEVFDLLIAIPKTGEAIEVAYQW